MIVNPVVYGGGSGKIYHFEADSLAQESAGFPGSGSARAGEYVVTTSGVVSGTLRLLTADKQYAIIDSINTVSTVDQLPPLARQKLESVPSVMAPPPSVVGYAFFVMPEEDVYIETI